MNKLFKKKSDRFTNLIINIILIALGFIALYPLWFVLIASISDPGAVSRGEVLLLPKDITFTAYTSMLENPSIWIGYRNSILYLFGGTFIMLLVTLPAAYALSRKELFGRRIFNFIFVFSMYFGGGMIAVYLLHSSIGWLDTPWVLVIPASMSVYNMILARSNFQEIPESLREAAIIDGASEFYYFARIVIPLSKAVIAVLFLFTALSWWNEYMRFIIYIDDPNLQSLQVIIRRIFDSLTETSEFSSAGEVTAKLRQAEMLKYSVVVIAALPFCLLYPFIQKYFNKGVMIGAVKG
ncbi:MAG: carbohydrate ABC transporter permease [Tyzzerella sp.]|nr:carbohydrate ABC transporter permease [Tyzzerella sp.]